MMISHDHANARAAMVVHSQPQQVSPEQVPNAALLRRRWTCATFGRVMKLKALVLELSVRGEMYPEDICSFLKCSPSCTRKYVKELLAAGVIRAITGADMFARTAYALAAEAGVAGALIAWEPRRPERLERHELRRSRERSLPPGHHVHLLDDDIPVQRSRVGLPRRDPLVEAFFGKPGGSPGKATLL